MRYTFNKPYQKYMREILKAPEGLDFESTLPEGL